MMTKIISPSNASPPCVPHLKIVFAISKVTHTRRPETGRLSTYAHARIFYGLRPALLDQSQF